MGRDERPSVGMHRHASTAHSHPIAAQPTQRPRKEKSEPH